VLPQWLAKLVGQQRQPILSALAIMNDNVPGAKVETFDAQPRAFEQA